MRERDEKEKMITVGMRKTAVRNGRKIGERKQKLKIEEMNKRRERRRDIGKDERDRKRNGETYEKEEEINRKYN